MSMQSMPESAKAVRRDRTDRTKDRVVAKDKVVIDAPKRRRREGDKEVKASAAAAAPAPAVKVERNDVKQEEARAPRVRKTLKKPESEKRIPDVSEVIPEQEAVVIPSSEIVSEVPGDATIEMLLKTRKGAFSRTDLTMAFDMLLTRLESEMTETRDSKKRDVNIRIWKSLINDVKKLKVSSLKSMKKSKRVPTTGNKSGFMKPMAISEEMIKFTGWDVSELKSRNDVTKYVCDYIKDNNLQNPKDKRQINSDRKLRELLAYDPETESEPLTYCTIQKKIQRHFS